MRFNPIFRALDANDVVIASQAVGPVDPLNLGTKLWVFGEQVKARYPSAVRLVVDVSLPEEEQRLRPASAK